MYLKQIRIYLILTFLILINHSYSFAGSEFDPQDSPHFTIILNQVRGPECCDRGAIKWFRQQQQELANNNLIGNFAIRYDALINESYVKAITSDTNSSYGAFFEITPQLAKDAGVAYKSDPARWYEAQNVYLIGYNQEERKNLIDTYLSTFEAQLGFKPKFSSAWMIDAWSLQYLKTQKGIRTHQITREQFGTDSYTLYGGPYHYPYYPSSNWAMIPDMSNTQMPLMIRQTISDPVYVYGDKTDSYTSQPNDYYIRNDTTDYFLHLFNQAHSQKNPYTFALLGLENTMPEEVQAEYVIQLKEVAKWQAKSGQNKVTSVADFEKWLQTHRNITLSSYQGIAAKDNQEQAWWINTPNYRARVRLSAGELSITDLRLYDKRFTDPYLREPAKSLGWWIVPFVLDGSRYFNANSDGIIIKNDTLRNRTSLDETPARIVIQNNISNVELQNQPNGKVLTQNGSPILEFTSNQIQLSSQTSNDLLNIQPAPIKNLSWLTTNGKVAWEFSRSNNILTTTVHETDLDEFRTKHRQLLFPEKQFEQMNAEKSYLHINNSYAIAGRNPIRVVLFPKNNDNEAILLPTYPKVVTTPALNEIDIHEQHQNNCMIFIDISNANAQNARLTLEQDDFKKELNIYFAPNCKEQKLHCVLHPRQAWWYVRTVIGDKIRANEEKKQEKASFADQQ